MVLETGSVPDITLTSTSGQRVALRTLERAIIYFYPKDKTPGCTVQACGFRDSKSEFDQRGWAVYGVSTDGIESHESFINSYDLTFELLTDPNHEAAEAFGVWTEKKMFGKTFHSTKRVTFAIENGTIMKVWTQVNVKTNAKDVLDWIDTRSV